MGITLVANKYSVYHINSPGMCCNNVSNVNSFGFKLTIVFFTGIYSLVCLGSGLKQVYYLRNFEIILLVLGSSIASSFLLECF